MIVNQRNYTWIEDALNDYVRNKSDAHQAAVEIGVAFAISARLHEGTIVDPSSHAQKQTRHFDNAMLDCVAHSPKKVRAVIEIAKHSSETQGLLDRLEIAYAGKRFTLMWMTNPSRAPTAVKLIKARARSLKNQRQAA